MSRKYDHIPVEEDNIRRMVECGLKKIPPQANDALETPITVEELRSAVKHGKAKKAPGRDGICNEFFQHTWEVIKNMLT
jgi:hypothetical protein